MLTRQRGPEGGSGVSHKVAGVDDPLFGAYLACIRAQEGNSLSWANDAGRYTYLARFPRVLRPFRDREPGR